MRLFQELSEAISEIRRDLYKSPEGVSGRVQNIAVNRKVHEALNYVFTLGDIHSVPLVSPGLVRLGQENFDFWRKADPEKLEAWLDQQLAARMLPERNVNDKSDAMHPELEQFLEGNTFSYNYAERMVGLFDVVPMTLGTQWDTRRAYWPIYTPQDAMKMGRMTRIPCTLGMDFVVRNIPGQGRVLHCTLLQRSCDFEKFWLSDIWFAVQIQLRIANQIKVRPGQFTHIALSLHAFEPDEEVY